MTAPEESVHPSSIWSTDDGAHLVEVQSPELAERLRAVTRRTQLFEIGQRASMGVGVCAALWRGFTFGDGDNGFAETLLAHAWVLVWIGAAGLLVGRALPARRLVGFALTGFFFIPILVKLAHGPITRWAGVGTNWATAGAVPLIEESMKALPLVVLVVAMRRDPSRSISVLDFGLAGFALGAGFAIHEDLLWERTLVGGHEGLSGWLAPSIVVDPLLVVGHAGWTALIGLGLGIAVVHRGRGPAWLAAVLAAVLAVGDHAAANFRGDTDVRAWVLDGRLAVYALLGGLVAAMLSGLVVQRWATARDRVFPAVGLKALVVPSTSLLASGDYERERSMAHTGAWRRFAPGYEAPSQPHVPVLLFDGASRAGVVVDPSASTGEPEPATSPRRRTSTRVVVALALLALVAGGVLWLTRDDSLQVAEPSEREKRTDPDPVEDSQYDRAGGDPDGDPTADTGGKPIPLESMTVIWVRHDDDGESTVVAARDGERQIVRADDMVIYRDRDGGFHCAPAGDGWRCGESALDPWQSAAVLGSYVPDSSMEFESADGLLRTEVYDQVIAGRPARCSRQTSGSGSTTEEFEFCVEPLTRIVLLSRTDGGDGTFGGSSTRLEAREVRPPQPGDFDLPSNLDLGDARDQAGS